MGITRSSTPITCKAHLYYELRNFEDHVKSKEKKNQNYNKIDSFLTQQNAVTQ